MKRKLAKADIESEKNVYVVFPDKDNPKIKMIGLVQEMAFVEKEEVRMVLKPMVVKACFEGDNVRFGIRSKDIGKLMERVKSFESSEHEVLVISGRKTFAYSKKEFNRMLESLLQKMVTKKYLQELHKALKKDIIV